MLIGGYHSGTNEFNNTNITHKFDMQLIEEEKLHRKLTLIKDEKFPSLTNKRSMHSCFVLRDYLFVIFGSRNDAEYIDLKKPLEFKQLKVEGCFDFKNAIVLINDEKVRFFAESYQGRRVPNKD